MCQRLSQPISAPSAAPSVSLLPTASLGNPPQLTTTLLPTAALVAVSRDAAFKIEAVAILFSAFGVLFCISLVHFVYSFLSHHQLVLSSESVSTWEAMQIAEDRRQLLQDIENGVTKPSRAAQWDDNWQAEGFGRLLELTSSREHDFCMQYQDPAEGEGGTDEVILTARPDRWKPEAKHPSPADAAAAATAKPSQPVQKRGGKNTKNRPAAAEQNQPGPPPSRASAAAAYTTPEKESASAAAPRRREPPVPVPVPAATLRGAGEALNSSSSAAAAAVSAPSPLSAGRSHVTRKQDLLEGSGGAGGAAIGLDAPPLRDNSPTRIKVAKIDSRKVVAKSQFQFEM